MICIVEGSYLLINFAFLKVNNSLEVIRWLILVKVFVKKVSLNRDYLMHHFFRDSEKRQQVNG